MNELTACIFPDTMPCDGVLFPLVQVFDRIVYCQAVEEQGAEEAGLSDLAEELVRKRLCTFFAPAPLGENRERFLALIRELRTRRDDYASQLGTLSLAGMGHQPLPGQKESGSSIIDHLLQLSGIREKRDRELLLWQARLVLQLAEIYDQEQARLEQELERINALQDGLFAELRKETGDDFSLTRKLDAISSLSGNQLALRLKAWTRLLFLGTRALNPPNLFITTSRDALDRLEEQYERHRHTPRLLLRITLPAQPAPGEDPLARRDSFRDQGQELLDDLAGLIADPSATAAEEPIRFLAEDSPWARLLDQVFPAPDCGRRRLELMYFPDISARQLFMEAFAADLRDLRQEADTETPAGLLVGHLG